MSNDISFESSHRDEFKNIFFEFCRYILTNIQRFENLWGGVPYPENDGREGEKMIDR
ncbi:unnamed protein product [Meloidogyne enterolobii]|uniref:Uncharacterized protein n=2 Tax=Meloidogyne enterolobii TaxID=390850 RepID=A0ACB0Y646_MELEN